MSNQQLMQMHPCNLSAHAMFVDHSNPVVCRITDISSQGGFLITDENIFLPDIFDLYIGLSNSPRACRITHREVYGIIVEFIDPVRHDVEDVLVEYAFKEALLFEALNPSLRDKNTPLKGCFRNTVDAIMALIERRNAMSWQIKDYRADPANHIHKTMHVTGNIVDKKFFS